MHPSHKAPELTNPKKNMKDFYFYCHTRDKKGGDLIFSPSHVQCASFFTIGTTLRVEAKENSISNLVR